MNRIITPFATVLLVVAKSFAGEADPPHITVYGTATTEVVPDQMIWSVKVENKGLSLENVASEHTKIVQTTLGFLKDSKVNEKTIQTSRMEFGENWEYRSSSQVRNGYIAATDIAFKITDFELYKKLWLGLAKLSAVSVEGVAYDHTKRIQYQNETRQQAVLAAKEKAANMAKAVASEIGEPVLVEEDISVSEGWQRNRAVQVVNNLRAIAGEDGGRTDFLAPGTIPITMRVKAAFRLVTAQK